MFNTPRLKRSSWVRRHFGLTTTHETGIGIDRGDEVMPTGNEDEAMPTRTEDEVNPTRTDTYRGRSQPNMYPHAPRTKSTQQAPRIKPCPTGTKDEVILTHTEDEAMPTYTEDEPHRPYLPPYVCTGNVKFRISKTPLWCQKSFFSIQGTLQMTGHSQRRRHSSDDRT